MADALDALVSEAAASTPRAAALVDETGTIDYAALEGRVSALAACVAASGAAPGSRVGILSRNSPESVALFFAVSRAGAVAVPMNHTLPPAALAAQAADCGLHALWAETAFEKKAEAVCGACGARKLALPGGLAASFPTRSTDPAAAAVILYTSGTTGAPLGVTLSHGNLLGSARSIRAFLGLTAADRACLVLPIFYVYGLSVVLAHFEARASVVLENRFLYPSMALDAMEKSGATGFSGVSSHYAILLERTDFAERSLPCLRYFTQAGDPMPPRLTRRILEAFPAKKLYLMYGQTEAGPRLTYLAPERAAKKPLSVGRPVPGVELRVIDDRGGECAVRREGEVVAKGANVMMGYWNRPGETAAALKDGWLRTGDVGYLDEEGDLFLVGRKKNLIKSGGHRISPVEIERAAEEYPAVSECAAVSEPDPLLGERLVLYVTPLCDTAAVGAFLKKRLPTYKLPARVVALAALPKNAYGKIDRLALIGKEE